MKKLSLGFFALLLILNGCASTLPDKVDVSKSYSLQGVKTYTLKTTCGDTQISNLDKAILPDYCQTLESNIKIALRDTNSEFRYELNSPDLSIDVNLEVLNGGSAAARFWVGFGAGRSITTVYIKVLKSGNIIAEGRITETTTMPNLQTGISNESAILQDVPLIAKRIAAFVNDPLSASTQK
jgi:hypothetical protein